MGKFHVDEFVLMVGDAAHTLFPPEINEGINAGLEDCETLHNIIEASNKHGQGQGQGQGQGPQPFHTIFSEYNSHRQEDIQGIVDMSSFLNESYSSNESSETKSRYLSMGVEVLLKKLKIISSTSMEMFSSKKVFSYQEIAATYFKRNKYILPWMRYLVKPADKISSVYSTLKGYISSATGGAGAAAASNSNSNSVSPRGLLLVSPTSTQ